MSHLKQYKNTSLALEQGGGVLNNPLVIHLEEEDQVLYSTPDVPSSKLKLQDDRLVLEDVLVPGFVDLGLSVMWAECNLGASSPEGEGNLVTWGIVNNTDSIVSLSNDQIYTNSDSNIQVLNPRTPSPNEIRELLDNTTASEETINGVSMIRYTSTNGNSILLHKDRLYWTNSIRGYGSQGAGNTYYASTFKNGVINDNDTTKGTLLMKRGVCDYPPKGQILILGNNYNIKPNTIYALRRDISDTRSIQITADNSNARIMFLKEDLTEFGYQGFINSTLKMYYMDLKSIGGEYAGTEVDDIYIYFKITNASTLYIEKYEPVDSEKYYSLGFNNIISDVEKGSNFEGWRFKYSDIKDKDFTIENLSGSTITMYIGNTWPVPKSTTHDSILHAQRVNKGSTYTIPAETVNSWANKVDENGYFYIRTVNANNSISFKFSY